MYIWRWSGKDTLLRKHVHWSQLHVKQAYEQHKINKYFEGKINSEKKWKWSAMLYSNRGSRAHLRLW